MIFLPKKEFLFPRPLQLKYSYINRNFLLILLFNNFKIEVKDSSAAGADDQVFLSNGECRPRADGDMGQLAAGRLFETSRSQKRHLQNSVHLTSPHDVEAKVS